MKQILDDIFSSIKQTIIVGTVGVAIVGGIVGGVIYQSVKTDEVSVLTSVWDCEVAFLAMSVADYGYNPGLFDNRLGKALCTDFVNNGMYDINERIAYLTELAHVTHAAQLKMDRAILARDIVADEQNTLEQIHREVTDNGGIITVELSNRIMASQARSKKAMLEYEEYSNGRNNIKVPN